MKKNDETEATGGEVFTSCKNWGKGGHYRINPETGAREKYDPNAEVAVVDATQSAPVDVTNPVTTKEKSRGR